MIAARWEIGGVAFDVASGPVKVPLAADQAVPVVGLPQGSLTTLSAVDFARGETLPGVDQIREPVFAEGTEEGVDMIGHDDEGRQLVAVTVEVGEGIRGDSGVLGIAKETRTVALVEPTVDALGKAFMVGLLGGFVPWLRMVLDPEFAFVAPFDEKCLGERVGEAVGKENSHLSLLPVR